MHCNLLGLVEPHQNSAAPAPRCRRPSAVRALNSTSVGPRRHPQDAAKLLKLVAAWENLVIDGGHQKVDDHLAIVRGHLGPMPSASQPSELALWIGAYINPLPAFGAAWD